MLYVSICETMNKVDFLVFIITLMITCQCQLLGRVLTLSQMIGMWQYKGTLVLVSSYCLELIVYCCVERVILNVC